MEDLVARAREADARLAEVREGAVPAGDPDPYREPPGLADDEDDLDRDDLDGNLDRDDLDGNLDGDEPENASPGSRSSHDLLGGTSAAGDHGAGYSRP
jgi:ribosome-binding factor A